MSENIQLAAVLIIVALIPLVLIYWYILHTLRKEFYRYNKHVQRDDGRKYHLSLLASVLTIIGIALLIECVLDVSTALLLMSSAVILVAVLLGVTFAFGRGRSLIADYSNIGSSEHSEYDEYKNCRMMSGFMFLMAAFFIIVLIMS